MGNKINIATLIAYMMCMLVCVRISCPVGLCERACACEFFSHFNYDDIVAVVFRERLTQCIRFHYTHLDLVRNFNIDDQMDRLFLGKNAMMICVWSGTIFPLGLAQFLWLQYFIVFFFSVFCISLSLTLLLAGLHIIIHNPHRRYFITSLFFSNQAESFSLITVFVVL